MIGQGTLKYKLQTMYDAGTLPHCIILAGDKGSGRKTLLDELFDGIYLESPKVESVRKMIELAHSVSNRVFILADIDNMSPSGKNALLKVLEECPNNNYFIMTVQDPSNLPTTVRSRAQLFRMIVYTPDEMYEYLNTRPEANTLSLEQWQFIRSVARTPGDVNELLTYDIDAFREFVEKTFNHIEKAGGANVFKLTEKLSTKEGDGKWSISLFFTVFSQLCVGAMTCHLLDGEYDPNDTIKYGNGCRIVSKYLSKLTKASINKQFVLDSWILEIRRAWM